jgi:hypothetical protein
MESEDSVCKNIIKRVVDKGNRALLNSIKNCSIDSKTKSDSSCDMSGYAFSELHFRCQLFLRCNGWSPMFRKVGQRAVAIT